MGEKQHRDAEHLTNMHHYMLASMQRGGHGINGVLVINMAWFAAKLTESQAQKIAGHSDYTNNFYALQTTRSWDYLGLSPQSPSNPLHDTNLGDGIIVCLLDTEIWPESEAFNDEGLGPIPKRWKGRCVSGDRFNATRSCNRKLIGAKYFIRRFLDESDQPFNTTAAADFLSPRDVFGHGTHTSTIAAGSFVRNASYRGLAPGLLRGGAPRARVAMYKVCWRTPLGALYSAADVLKAIDEAISDGVDVLSLSLGGEVPPFSEVDERDGIATGSFHAVAKGDSCRLRGTVENTAPWILTAAASTVPTRIVLGNNWTILGQAMFRGKEVGFTGLVYPENPGLLPTLPGICESLTLNNTPVAGNVVLCFTTLADLTPDVTAVRSVRAAGGVGVIIAKHPGDDLGPCSKDFPCIEVDYELGTRTQILYYIRSTSIIIFRVFTLYSSLRLNWGSLYQPRLPTSHREGLAPANLKPDIAAPGVRILAASSPFDPSANGGFALHSGTSMATPLVSSIVALLKALHPSCSPAAIKSALVTTDWAVDQHYHFFKYKSIVIAYFPTFLE
ncbi:Peptidase S8, subtilisin-related [Parasponia andersonii]|uniref:Peptidase S8, subtilisin-related n=1 Tax=Parasponia andersonii TaxID=3476 RepID=A0A2P5AML8_PARAD|nr:Peptidase S8, subtilisin-related [Parasponia andersonii]